MKRSGICTQLCCGRWKAAGFLFVPNDAARGLYRLCALLAITVCMSCSAEPASITLVRSDSYAEDGRWVIEGEVRNGGAEPIEGLTVVGSWFSQGSGQAVREQAGEIGRPRLARGEASTFRVSTGADNNVDAGGISTKVTFRRQNGELTLTDARSAAPEPPASSSDAGTPAVLDDPRDAPGTAVPIADIYAAYQANPAGTLQSHGGGLFTGRVESVQRLDQSPQWAAYVTFDGRKVAAYFLPEDWSRIANPVIAGQERTFVCLEADAARMPQLLLLACDVADR